MLFQLQHVQFSLSGSGWMFTEISDTPKRLTVTADDLDMKTKRLNAKYKH